MDHIDGLAGVNVHQNHIVVVANPAIGAIDLRQAVAVWIIDPVTVAEERTVEREADPYPAIVVIAVRRVIAAQTKQRAVGIAVAVPVIPAVRAPPRIPAAVISTAIIAAHLPMARAVIVATDLTVVIGPVAATFGHAAITATLTVCLPILLAIDACAITLCGTPVLTAICLSATLALCTRLCCATSLHPLATLCAFLRKLWAAAVDRSGPQFAQERAQRGQRVQTRRAAQTRAERQGGRQADRRQDRRSAQRDGTRVNRQQNRQAYRQGRRDGRVTERRRDRTDNHRQVRRNNYRAGHRQVRRDYRGGDYRRWNTRWRSDRRYNWNRYRYSNRSLFRLGRYYAPYRNYNYRRIGIGFSLDSAFFGNRYWINDPYSYRLPQVYGPYRWVRYYDDVILVNIYTGQTVDVIHDFFW